MGYTHYWKQEKPFSEEQWSKFLQKVKKIVKTDKATVPLEFSSDPDHLMLNGKEPDDYEDFYIQRRVTDFSFCKTAQRPYDRTVITILALAAKELPGFSWTSDGRQEAYDEAAKALAGHEAAWDKPSKGKKGTA